MTCDVCGRYTNDNQSEVFQYARSGLMERVCHDCDPPDEDDE